MLSEDQIAQALHASRIVALPALNPHGPLGLEQLREVVAQFAENEHRQPERIQRPITLPIETWEKLDELARAATPSSAPPLTASMLASALLQQAVTAK